MIKKFKAMDKTEVAGRGAIVLVDIPLKKELPKVNEDILVDHIPYIVKGVETSNKLSDPPQRHTIVGLRLMRSKYRKLNCHAHTNYSDGRNTMEEAVIAYKENDFNCAVFTDHYYSCPELSKHSLTPAKFRTQVLMAKQLEKQYDIPVIVGCEMVFNDMEEVNVFGHEAILYIMQNGTALDIFKQARILFKCAMSLNHPRLIESLKTPLDKVLDAYEVYNHGQCFFKQGRQNFSRTIPKMFRSLKPISNSDAHCMKELNCGYNLITANIKTENDLIDWIKYAKAPEMVHTGS